MYCLTENEHKKRQKVQKEKDEIGKKIENINIQMKQLGKKMENGKRISGERVRPKITGKTENNGKSASLAIKFDIVLYMDRNLL